MLGKSVASKVASRPGNLYVCDYLSEIAPDSFLMGIHSVLFLDFFGRCLRYHTRYRDIDDVGRMMIIIVVVIIESIAEMTYGMILFNGRFN